MAFELTSPLENMDPRICHKCNKKFSLYQIRIDNEDQEVRFCWKDGTFDVVPHNTQFALAVHINPTMIFDLIKMDLLKKVD